jgi:CrcB protein
MSFPFWHNPAIRIPVAISLGAIAGSLCRYYIGLWFKNIALVDYFAFGTLFVNITGSFLMGLFITLIAEKLINLSPEIIAMITVGFLGSYTTFSSYESEAMNLLLQGQKQWSILYWLGSPILGFMAINFGIFLGKFMTNKIS